MIFNTVFLLSIFVQVSVSDQIKNMNQEMEQAFSQGDLLKVARFYSDDAVLLSASGKIVEGREDIDAYWTGMKNPVSWKLDVIEVSQNEKDIYEHAYYKSLKNKPLGWRAKGFEFDDQDNLVYQLGHSTLTTIHDGKERSSEVDFILIWQATDQGFRVLLDTYSWQ